MVERLGVLIKKNNCSIIWPEGKSYPKEDTIITIQHVEKQKNKEKISKPLLLRSSRRNYFSNLIQRESLSCI